MSAERKVAMKRNQYIQIHQSAAQNARPFPHGSEAVAEFIQIAKASREPTSAGSNRHSARIEMDARNVILSVIHPGGTHSSSHSLLMDIGPGGASVLYPGFLHTDTECVIHIESTAGQMEMLSASIAWCRVLCKGVHMVGMRWTELFDIRNFLPPDKWGELGPSGDNRASPDLTGRILTIGVDALEIELFKMLLKDLPIEVRPVPFSGAALDSLHTETFDMILVNGDCSELDFESFVSKLRHEGFVEPLMVVIDRKNIPSQNDAKDVQFLARPLAGEDFVASVRKIMLGATKKSGGSKPIVSSRADNPALRQAIGTFVRHAQGLGQPLKAAVSADNAEQARKCLVLLYNTAAGFGFEGLREAAGEALKALDASGSAQEAGPAIKQFVRTLDRLQAPDKPADAA